jgi:hypothetical protein
MFADDARRLQPGGHAQFLSRPVEVGVHRVAGKAQALGDFLGIQALMHQGQAVPFARREQLDRFAGWFRRLAHRPLVGGHI